MEPESCYENLWEKECQNMLMGYIFKNTSDSCEPVYQFYPPFLATPVTVELIQDNNLRNSFL